MGSLEGSIHTNQGRDVCGERLNRRCPLDSSIYDDRYYLHGKENHLSLYENYRWLPTLSKSMVVIIAQKLGITTEDTILDFGAARGYIVRAFRELGYQAWGVDASAWAIENCDPAVKQYVSRVPEMSGFDTRGTTYLDEYDYVIAKDVLEHIPKFTLQNTIEQLIKSARKGLFVVVPLSPSDGEPYVAPEYEQDVTHCQRLTLDSWVALLTYHGFCTTGVYRIPGVKDNYAQFAEGNGFIICRRLPEESDEEIIAQAQAGRIRGPK